MPVRNHMGMMPLADPAAGETAAVPVVTTRATGGPGAGLAPDPTTNRQGPGGTIGAGTHPAGIGAVSACCAPCHPAQSAICHVNRLHCTHMSMGCTDNYINTIFTDTVYITSTTSLYTALNVVCMTSKCIACMHVQYYTCCVQCTTTVAHLHVNPTRRQNHDYACM